MRCKTGDIARIVGADTVPERADLRKVVEVGAPFSITGDARPHWWCTSLCEPLTVLTYLGGRWTGDILRTSTAAIPDEHLQPLHPPPVLTDVIEEASA